MSRRELAKEIKRVDQASGVRLFQAKVLSIGTWERMTSESGPVYTSTTGATLNIQVNGVTYNNVPCLDNVIPIVYYGQNGYDSSCWVADLGDGKWLIVGTTSGYDGTDSSRGMAGQWRGGASSWTNITMHEEAYWTVVRTPRWRVNQGKVELLGQVTWTGTLNTNDFGPGTDGILFHYNTSPLNLPTNPPPPRYQQTIRHLVQTSTGWSGVTCFTDMTNNRYRTTTLAVDKVVNNQSLYLDGVSYIIG